MPARIQRKQHKHKLKLVAFNEQTGVAKYACKCGFAINRTAKFICQVPGAGNV